ncbi:MAG: hypothetical protein H7233_15900 [Pseudorhodobacter sp.]|nr:hypothetical protein [Frankiaceae bacterium]
MSGDSRALSASNEPPMRRFSMTITAEGDCTDALIDVLKRADLALSEQPDTALEIVSWQGWTLTVTENAEALAGDEYDAALLAWWQARKGETASPYEGGLSHYPTRIADPDARRTD